jgi:hypothetical protein
LGLAPGTVLEWRDAGDHVIVQRAGKYTSEELHAALFSKQRPPRKTLAELQEGIRSYVRKRHARR